MTELEQERNDDSTDITEATVLQKILDVTDDEDGLEVLDYEVDEMRHTEHRYTVRVEMAVRYQGYSGDQLSDEEDDIEVWIGSSGGVGAFRAIAVTGEYKRY